MHSLSYFNDHQWQQFIYLLILLVVIGSSVFSRHNMPIGKIIKYLGIWSAFAVFAVILYSYRYEFSDVKNRLSDELSPASARIEDSGEMIINLARDGHFYLDLRVNNNNMRFMIDTGASDMVISLEHAKKLGINVENLRFNKTYQTANGKSRGASIILNEVQIGNNIFQNVAASVNQGKMGKPLLGMRFLRKFKKYEFYRDKLILTP